MLSGASGPSSSYLLQGLFAATGGLLLLLVWAGFGAKILQELRLNLLLMSIPYSLIFLAILAGSIPIIHDASVADNKYASCPHSFYFLQELAAPIIFIKVVL